MDQEIVIQKTIDFVKETLSDAEGGHDWWHIYRVWKLSKRIAEAENVDNFVVELGALLHDIADSKFYDGDEEIGPYKAREFLSSLDVAEEVIIHVKKLYLIFLSRATNTLKNSNLPSLMLFKMQID